MNKRNILVFAIVILNLFTAGWSDVIELPKTGQTRCYDKSGSEIICTGTGQDGEFQTGFDWSGSRFVDNNDGTVLDSLTGLIWLKNANCFSMQNWSNALDLVNNLQDGQCGLTDGSKAGDWRLPNVNEYESIVHWGYNQELCGNTSCASLADWLNSQGFQNVNPYQRYWTSNTSAHDTNTAWTFAPWNGTDYFYNKGMSYFVWAVRSGQNGTYDPKYPINIPKTGQTTSYAKGDDGDLQMGVSWPVPRFEDNGNGTLIDKLTGIVWLKNANCFGAHLWDNSFALVSNLSSGQCDLTDGSKAGDWRLPNINEFRSLMDISKTNPALSSGHFFYGIDNNLSYSSSTTNVERSNYGLVVHLKSGVIHDSGKDYPAENGLLPIRAGRFRIIAVSKTGSGTGVVSSIPAGIECGSDCSDSFSVLSQVNIIATADNDSVFGGWGGDCAACVSNQSCQITMDGHKSCEAIFNKKQIEDTGYEIFNDTTEDIPDIAEDISDDIYEDVVADTGRDTTDIPDDAFADAESDVSVKDTSIADTGYDIAAEDTNSGNETRIKEKKEGEGCSCSTIE